MKNHNNLYNFLAPRSMGIVKLQEKTSSLTILASMDEMSLQTIQKLPTISQKPKPTPILT
jgi:hypothetical protein